MLSCSQDAGQEVRPRGDRGQALTCRCQWSAGVCMWTLYIPRRPRACLNYGIRALMVIVCDTEHQVCFSEDWARMWNDTFPKGLFRNLCSEWIEPSALNALWVFKSTLQWNRKYLDWWIKASLFVLSRFAKIASLLICTGAQKGKWGKTSGQKCPTCPFSPKIWWAFKESQHEFKGKAFYRPAKL